jgi:hypothetical protein
VHKVLQIRNTFIAQLPVTFLSIYFLFMRNEYQ